MAKVIAGMTMSLDGFVADRKGSAGPLYPDLAASQGSDYMNAMISETGAVLMGRGSFEMAADPDRYVGNYEFQVPIFVLTHRPPDRIPNQDEHLTFTFVTDGVRPAIAAARAAAGEKAVTVVGGAGLVDELRVDLMPVLLGQGQRLFVDADPNLHLRKTAVDDVGPRTSLRFSVSR